MRQIKFRAWNTVARSWQEEWSGMTCAGRKLIRMPDKSYTVSDDVALVFQQFTGLLDKAGREVYEGDIVRVYDTERYCICGEWEDCCKKSGDCESHGEHGHEHPNDCENYICTQAVKWAGCTGYFSDEDTGEFCPALGSDEIELEVIGNIYENPELIPKGK